MKLSLALRSLQTEQTFSVNWRFCSFSFGARQVLHTGSALFQAQAVKLLLLLEAPHWEHTLVALSTEGTGMHFAISDCTNSRTMSRVTTGTCCPGALMAQRTGVLYHFEIVCAYSSRPSDHVGGSENWTLLILMTANSGCFRGRLMLRITDVRMCIGRPAICK